MKTPWVVLICIISSVIPLFEPVFSNLLENEIRKTEIALKKFNSEYKKMWFVHQSAEWNFSINATKSSSGIRASASAVFSEWMKEWKLWAREIDLDYFPSRLRDMVGRISSGIVIMDQNEAKLISELRSNLTTIYSSAAISFKHPTFLARGEGEFASLMSKSRNPFLLKKIWIAWREQVGERTRPLFLRLFKLLDRAARENGYDNLGSSWTGELGIDNVFQVALSLWEEVKDFYAHLHAYAREKLKSFYGEPFFTDNELIPAHLLGSLWSENWSSLIDILSPFPDDRIFNLTEVLESNKLSVLDLIKRAEAFYVEAGFPMMTNTFWKKSVFEKAKDRPSFDCHATSFDFALHDDFRIRMCGSAKEQSFFEAIHEMGHIQYYMAYRHRPMLFRGGASSAFHEAVGETMLYAAQNPECLRSMKLFTTFPNSNGAFLNFLMKQALSKFVLLPWALTVELWRHGLLSGDIKEEEMNEKWWELRKDFQGINPPDAASSDLFDAGTKYHIINNIPYMRYFIGRFLEHQFLEALCGRAKSVHPCCFSQSKNVGRRFRSMLSLGSSVPWQEALNSLTGEREILAKPLLNYYEPLYRWLVNYNKQNNILVTL